MVSPTPLTNHRQGSNQNSELLVTKQESPRGARRQVSKATQKGKLGARVAGLKVPPQRELGIKYDYLMCVLLSFQLECETMNLTIDYVQ